MAASRSFAKVYFYQFAIRTTIRNNNTMKRDDVIKQVADAVGPRHSVDLKNYDRLVVVDIYRVEWRRHLGAIITLTDMLHANISNRTFWE